MKEYYDLLKKQYLESIGYKNDENISSDDLAEFIILRQKMSDIYLNLLNKMELLYSRDKELIESGKGCYDSVAKSIASATIITPNTLGFDVFDEHRIIKGGLKVNNCTPLLYKRDENGVNNITAIDNSLLLMTQNPYTEQDIKNWHQLHNCTDNRIIVGVYGDNYDKDKISKINSLRELRSKLEGDVFEDLITKSGTYYYIVATKERQKMLKKYYRGTSFDKDGYKEEDLYKYVYAPEIKNIEYKDDNQREKIYRLPNNGRKLKK